MITAIIPTFDFVLEEKITVKDGPQMNSLRNLWQFLRSDDWLPKTTISANYDYSQWIAVSPFLPLIILILLGLL